MSQKTAHARPNPPANATRRDSEHFFTCSHCMQTVDRRDFGAVLLHESPTHRFKHGDRRREEHPEGDVQQSLQPVSDSLRKTEHHTERRVPFTPVAATPSRRVPITPAPTTQQQRTQPFTPPKPKPQAAPAPTTRAPSPPPAPPSVAPESKMRVEPAPRASAPNPPPAAPATKPKLQARAEPTPRASAPNPPSAPPPVAQKPRVQSVPAPRVVAADRPPAPPAQPELQLHDQPVSEASTAGLLPEQPFASPNPPAQVVPQVLAEPVPSARAPDPAPRREEARPSLNFLRAHEKAAAQHTETEPPRATAAPVEPVPQESPPAPPQPAPTMQPPPPEPAPIKQTAQPPIQTEQTEQPRPKAAAPDLSRFERCLECGGMLDGKELGQVAYHSRFGHPPKSDPNFERLQGRALTAVAEDRIR